MRNNKKPEERKQEILDAAQRLFCTRGYAQTKITDIISEIGMCKGLFYYYFESKEVILDAIVARIMDADISAIQAAAESALSAQERLAAQFEAHRAILAAQRPIRSEPPGVAENPELQVKLIRQSMELLAPFLAATLEQGSREGVFQVEYPRETAAVLLSAYTYHCLLETSDGQTAKGFRSVLEKSLCAKQGCFDGIWQ
jgi:AcrR family transcriptional regulator